MLAERIEKIDFGHVEALRGRRCAVLLDAVVCDFSANHAAQIGLTDLQLDSNLRASAVVGIVGAGGIGADARHAFGRYAMTLPLPYHRSSWPSHPLFRGRSGVIRKRIQMTSTFSHSGARRTGPRFTSRTHDALCHLSGLRAGDRPGR